MSTEYRIKTVVLPGGRIEIVIPELVEGQEVTVTIIIEDEKPVERRHVIDILESLPGHQVFKTAEEVDAYFREERDSWDR